MGKAGTKMRIIMEKCKWICLGPNNTETRYSLGRKLLKHFKDRKIGCKMVASASCRDHGVVGGQGGSGLGGGPPRRPTYRWLMASSEGSLIFLLTWQAHSCVPQGWLGWGALWDGGLEEAGNIPATRHLLWSESPRLDSFFFFFQFYFYTCFLLICFILTTYI